MDDFPDSMFDGNPFCDLDDTYDKFTKPAKKKHSKQPDLVLVDFDDILRVTPKAYLFDIGDSKIWIPKSQISDLDIAESTFKIPEWLAIDKELI